MASSRDRSRSPIRIRPVANGLAQVALGIVVQHERDFWLDNAEDVMNQQRDSIGILRLDVAEAREVNTDLQSDIAETQQVQIELLQRLLAHIQALETEVAELRARTAPQ